MKKIEKKEKEKIETQSPLNLQPVKKRKLELIKYLTALTIDYLRSAYKSLFGKPAAAKSKSELVNEAADALNFPSVTEFREWFYGLPEVTQTILYETAFTDYVPIPYFEKKFGISMLIEDRTYSWRIDRHFNPVLGLDFLPIYVQYGCTVTALPQFLQSVLPLWLAPPPLFQLSQCRTETPAEESWNNSLLISDIFPLLCDTVKTVLERINEGDREKILRGGFKKRDLQELRASTGFLPFSLGGDYAPDSVDLLARFVLCMYNYRPRRPEDGHEGIRNLGTAFFSDVSQYTQKWHAPDRCFLEYTICIDHLSRTPGYYLEHDNVLPESRKTFHDILRYIAQDGGWFDADKLTEHIRITMKDFAFCDKSLEKTLKIKAESLVIGDTAYSHAEYDEFHPEGILRFPLLTGPLFKAYCYIFAALGLVEIVQAMPPLVRAYHNKQYPLSPYNSLKALRITELGRWCLGATSKRPPRPAVEYQAIADRELFLVTVQGNSLERRVYLDKIGQRLGEDRWRISPASFIAGCANKRQITERIERFTTLIDPEPAPHWKQLFKKVLARAGLFDGNRPDILVYDLPENQELLEELLRDPELKRLVRRVEGRMLAVNAKDQRKFFALLSEHGIAHFSG